MNKNIDKLKNLSLSEVIKYFKDKKIKYRIVEEDGKGYCGIDDLIDKRYNLYVQNGIVTKIQEG